MLNKPRNYASLVAETQFPVAKTDPEHVHAPVTSVTEPEDAADVESPGKKSRIDNKDARTSGNSHINHSENESPLIDYNFVSSSHRLKSIHACSWS